LTIRPHILSPSWYLIVSSHTASNLVEGVNPYPRILRIAFPVLEIPFPR
jgi:hypothetical protein